MNDVETEARSGALEEILGMVDRARVQRLRSKLPKPELAAVPADPAEDPSMLDELAALVGEQAPPEG